MTEVRTAQINQPARKQVCHVHGPFEF